MKTSSNLEKARASRAFPKRKLKARLREYYAAVRVWIAEQFPLPEERIASHALALNGDAEELAVRLRACATPVVGRISKGRLLLDVLTISDDELPILAASLRSVLA